MNALRAEPKSGRSGRSDPVDETLDRGPSRHVGQLRRRGAYFGRIRAVIPAAPGYRFRNDAGANAGAIRALIPV
jgi:hypothetical protein